MSKIHGNWRIHQSKKIEVVKRMYQSVLSCILSVNLMITIPVTEANAMSAIHRVDDKEPEKMPDYEGFISAVSTNRRMPARVNDDFKTLSVLADNTRKKISEDIMDEDMIRVTVEDIEVEEVEEKEIELEELSIEESEEVEEEPEVTEPEPRYIPSDEEYYLLSQLIEAEVTGYDVWLSKGLTHEEVINAKVRVAQVFLNRVESERFPYNTLKECILEPYATSTLIDGRFYEVSATEYTKEAIDIALSPYTADLTRGALFFSSGDGEPYGGGTIFEDEVGHKFAL